MDKRKNGYFGTCPHGGDGVRTRGHALWTCQLANGFLFRTMDEDEKMATGVFGEGGYPDEDLSDAPRLHMHTDYPVDSTAPCTKHTHICVTAVLQFLERRRTTPRRQGARTLECHTLRRSPTSTTGPRDHDRSIGFLGYSMGCF